MASASSRSMGHGSPSICDAISSAASVAQTSPREPNANAPYRPGMRGSRAATRPKADAHRGARRFRRRAGRSSACGRSSRSGTRRGLARACSRREREIRQHAARRARCSPDARLRGCRDRDRRCRKSRRSACRSRQAAPRNLRRSTGTRKASSADRIEHGELTAHAARRLTVQAGEPHRIVRVREHDHRRAARSRRRSNRTRARRRHRARCASLRSSMRGVIRAAPSASCAAQTAAGEIAPPRGKNQPPRATSTPAMRDASSRVIGRT